MAPNRSNDRNSEAWTGSMVSDQVTRLNAATGASINYLLPRNTNIRRVFGSNHGASILKVEPLE